MIEKTIKPSEDPWMYHMRSGEFEQAWKISDRVLQERAGKPCWHLPRHFQYVWDGSSLENKRVLIRCYHGLGDTIQFIRYTSLLKRIAKEVIVWVQPPLIPLLQTIDSIDRLLPLDDGTPAVAYDVDIESMELPHTFKTTLQSIPSEVPYIDVQPNYLDLPGSKPRVGLVWKPGNWDLRRSIPFEKLTPLFELDHVQYIILQECAVEAGWKNGYGYYPGDFPLQEYASIIKGLDLLISIDSMPAHLAAAMNVRVWNILHADPDWRWMNDREDSPWYPSMRLFRQETQGEWDVVIAKLKKELRQL
jgi:hypothetical protein